MFVPFELFNYLTVKYREAVVFLKIMALYYDLPVFKDVYQLLS